MEFKKIDDTKFQCLLHEEDLEDNNITLDDFFRNDTAKIHGLLDVVIEEAQKSIGIIMDSSVMSLQLAPQPNHSILLTVSSGKEDFGDMLRQAGERVSQAVSAPHPKNDNKGNVIKKDTEEDGDLVKAAPFKPVRQEDADREAFAIDRTGELVGSDAVICRFGKMQHVEEFCANCPKTWGVKNMLYKNNADGSMYLILERTRCAKTKYEQFVNGMLDYGELIVYKEGKMAYIKEHYEMVIPANAVNIIKKYCI